MTFHSGRSRISLLCGVLLSVCGCGGSDEDGVPIVAGPTPTPTPAPTPTPSPTPSPTSTPTPSGPSIGQAGIGDTLRGPLACGQAGRLAFGPGLARVEALASVFVASDIAIAYNAVDTYGVSIGGVAAANSPDPAIKLTSLTGVYDYFRKDFGEFELYRNAASSKLTNVTIGRVSDQSRVCFFGAGGPAAYSPPSGVSTRSFSGFADGLAIDATDNYRLFQSVTIARVDYAARRVELRVEARAREFPFRNFRDFPFSETTVATGAAALGGDGIFTGTLSTATGYTGSFRGHLYGSTPGGMTIAYALRKSDTEFAWGAAGLDAD